MTWRLLLRYRCETVMIQIFLIDNDILERYRAWWMNCMPWIEWIELMATADCNIKSILYVCYIESLLHRHSVNGIHSTAASYHYLFDLLWKLTDVLVTIKLMAGVSGTWQIYFAFCWQPTINRIKESTIVSIVNRLLPLCKASNDGVA